LTLRWNSGQIGFGRPGFYFCWEPGSFSGNGIYVLRIAAFAEKEPDSRSDCARRISHADPLGRVVVDVSGGAVAVTEPIADTFRIAHARSDDDQFRPLVGQRGA